MSPLMVVTRPDICRKLLSVPEIEIDARNPAGQTALSIACSGGHLENIRLLIQAGASLNIVDKLEHTPWHYAEGESRRVIRESMTEKYGIGWQDLIQQTPSRSRASLSLSSQRSSRSSSTSSPNIQPKNHLPPTPPLDSNHSNETFSTFSFDQTEDENSTPLSIPSPPLFSAFPPISSPLQSPLLSSPVNAPIDHVPSDELLSPDSLPSHPPVLTPSSSMSTSPVVLTCFEFFRHLSLQFSEKNLANMAEQFNAFLIEKSLSTPKEYGDLIRIIFDYVMDYVVEIDHQIGNSEGNQSNILQIEFFFEFLIQFNNLNYFEHFVRIVYSQDREGYVWICLPLDQYHPSSQKYSTLEECEMHIQTEQFNLDVFLHLNSDLNPFDEFILNGNFYQIYQDPADDTFYSIFLPEEVILLQQQDKEATYQDMMTAKISVTNRFDAVKYFLKFQEEIDFGNQEDSRYLNLLRAVQYFFDQQKILPRRLWNNYLKELKSRFAQPDSSEEFILLTNLLKLYLEAGAIQDIDQYRTLCEYAFQLETFHQLNNIGVFHEGYSEILSDINQQLQRSSFSKDADCDPISSFSGEERDIKLSPVNIQKSPLTICTSSLSFSIEDQGPVSSNLGIAPAPPVLPFHVTPDTIAGMDSIGKIIGVFPGLNSPMEVTTPSPPELGNMYSPQQTSISDSNQKSEPKKSTDDQSYQVGTEEIVDIAPLFDSLPHLLKGRMNQSPSIDVVIKLPRQDGDLKHEIQILVQLTKTSDPDYSPYVKPFLNSEKIRSSYLVLERYPHNLDFFLDDCKDKSTRIDVMMKILKAYRDLHVDYHLMHGDVKSSNILVKQERFSCSIKICDFENSEFIEEGKPKLFRSQNGKLLYSFGWEAPELFFGDASSTYACYAIDIFQLGLLAYVIHNPHRTQIPLPLLPESHRILLRNQSEFDEYFLLKQHSRASKIFSQMCQIDPSKRSKIEKCFSDYRMALDMTGAQEQLHKENQENLRLKNEIVELGNLKERFDEVTAKVTNQIEVSAQITRQQQSAELEKKFDQLYEKLSNSLTASLTNVFNNSQDDMTITLNSINELCRTILSHNSSIDLTLLGNTLQSWVAAHFKEQFSLHSIQQNQFVAVQMNKVMSHLENSFRETQSESMGSISKYNDLLVDEIKNLSKFTHSLEISLNKMQTNQQLIQTLLEEMKEQDRFQNENMNRYFEEVLGELRSFRADFNHSQLFENSILVELIQKKILDGLMGTEKNLLEALSSQQATLTQLLQEVKIDLKDLMKQQDSVLIQMKSLIEFNDTALGLLKKHESNQENFSIVAQRVMDHLLSVQSESKIDSTEFKKSITEFQSLYSEEMKAHLLEHETRMLSQFDQLQLTLNQPTSTTESSNQIEKVFLDRFERFSNDQKEWNEKMTKEFREEIESRICNAFLKNKLTKSFKESHSPKTSQSSFSKEDIRELLTESISSFTNTTLTQLSSDLEYVVETSAQQLQKKLHTMEKTITSISTTQQADLQGIFRSPQYYLIAPQSSETTQSSSSSSSSSSTPSFNIFRPFSSVKSILNPYLFDNYTVSFLCSVCGEEGNHYTVRLSNENFLMFMNGIESLFWMFEVATLFFGLPIPRVSVLANKIKNFVSKSTINGLEDAIDISEKIQKRMGKIVAIQMNQNDENKREMLGNSPEKREGGGDGGGGTMAWNWDDDESDNESGKSVGSGSGSDVCDDDLNQIDSDGINSDDDNLSSGEGDGEEKERTESEQERKKRLKVMENAPVMSRGYQSILRSLVAAIDDKHCEKCGLRLLQYQDGQKWGWVCDEEREKVKGNRDCLKQREISENIICYDDLADWAEEKAK